MTRLHSPFTILFSAFAATLLAYAAPCGANEPAAGSAQDQASSQGTEADKSAARSLEGPNTVRQHLESDEPPPRAAVFDVEGFAPLQASRDAFYERTGFHIGSDYNSLYLNASDSLDDARSEAGSGVFRVYVKWDLLGRGTKNTGSLIVKGGNRNAYTELAPIELAPDLGYAGLLNLSHNDQGWRMTNLYWRQTFFDGEAVSYVGFVDVTDYTDLYPLTSYYTNFSNLVFGTGSGTVGGLPDGALGAMLGAWLTDHLYAIAGAADANPDQTDLFQGFSNVKDGFDTFKTFDIGWAASKDHPWSKNVHLTLYHTDRTKLGTPSGWGAHLSGSTTIGEHWSVFLRGGYGHDGGSPLEASVSAGFGYEGLPFGGLLGVGVNWGRPNDSTYGQDLDDQYTSEVFYRFQVTRDIQFTPSLQLLGNPALNPDEDLVAVLGLRLKVTF